MEEFQTHGTPTQWSTVQGIRQWLSSLRPANPTAAEREAEEREEREEIEFARDFGWQNAKRLAAEDVMTMDDATGGAPVGVLELRVMEQMGKKLKDWLLSDARRQRFPLVKISPNIPDNNLPSQVPGPLCSSSAHSSIRERGGGGKGSRE